MKAALALVLADPVFVRSPSLARLLEYLVEATICGRGKTLKSYSVAVDGLGKSPDFDSQADTYARVLVARLRKALDAFYATAGAEHNQRLLIEGGSYEVHLVAHGQASQTPARIRIGLPGRRLIAAGCIVLLILAAALIMQWRADSLAATQRWRVSNFPFVDVTVHAESGNGEGAELARRMRQSIIMNLDNYEGVRTAYNPSPGAEYSIDVMLRRHGEWYVENVSVIDRKLNRIISSESGNMTFNLSDSELSSDEFLRNLVFYITHPSGIIHANERRRNFSVDSPYGCWLYFSAMVQNNQTIGDKTLSECAGDWHSAAPNHPLAAALYGWALTDRSISAFTDGGRRAALQDAVSVLESARSMNPNSPLLQVAAMRAYAFSGDGAAMRAAADRALKLNPDSLDIQGVVGVMLSLQNDPQGDVLLNKAVAEHFNSPPWYFVGTFVSAMMRDDPASAGRSLVRLRELQHSLPILPILSAAYQARTGHLDEARAQWDRAKAIQPILRIMPDRFFSRMPIAPEVKRRLEQWLAPVLGKGA
ncbi:hypothetical protein H7F51_07335 [Novosphingobium flavum]|uniref:Tetratricopeptide repeat protein n=1 Tax=Novosphingobium flavum TaxID=1778672 RepID=A0A7X1FR02_9SPHN|nr:hypothetical protein [Novosphingobium flavum]MBC2665328.1 hypothetical protein [Novosphingobium flavum]